jgi:archaeosine-15-forming tRNA-guanine transglycosylase
MDGKRPRIVVAEEAAAYVRSGAQVYVQGAGVITTRGHG